MKKDMTLNRKRVFIEKFFHVLFLLAALVAVISVALIIIFIFGKGLAPFFPNNEYGTYPFHHNVSRITHPENSVKESAVISAFSTSGFGYSDESGSAMVFAVSSKAIMASICGRISSVLQKENTANSQSGNTVA